MTKRSITVFSVILLTLLTLCSQASSETEILIGLVPEENIFDQMARHKPLAAYLSEKLGSRVRFTILSRYGDVVDRFMSRKMSGAFFGVFTGVIAMEKLDAEPIARAVSAEGTSSVQSYIFVRKDSNIRNIHDMKGKKIAFVDKATVTGYLYALSFFRDNGVHDLKTFFQDMSFTGSHGSAIYAVLDGRADIGTVKSKIFRMLVKKDHMIGEELSIIAKSVDLPDTTLFLRKDVSPVIRTRMREVLLAMDKDPEGREVLRKLNAQMFVGAKKSDFQPFYEIAGKADINLKQYRYR